MTTPGTFEWFGSPSVALHFSRSADPFWAEGFLVFWATALRIRAHSATSTISKTIFQRLMIISARAKARKRLVPTYAQLAKSRPSVYPSHGRLTLGF